jgi:hypothetical protein
MTSDCALITSGLGQVHTFCIVNYAYYVAFLRRDQSKQEVFVPSMKCEECVACVVMQQVPSLAVNISRRVFLSTSYSEIIFCFVYSVKHSNSLIVEFLFAINGSVNSMAPVNRWLRLQVLPKVEILLWYSVL